MITAVDTNVLLDVVGADKAFGPASRNALRTCRSQGRLIACDVVWAETASGFVSRQAAEGALSLLGVDFSETSAAAAIRAGVAWRGHRDRGGTRTRLIADFLIGAHALEQADRLLTRDRGFYRSYFRRLRILDPSA